MAFAAVLPGCGGEAGTSAPPPEGDRPGGLRFEVRNGVATTFLPSASGARQVCDSIEAEGRPAALTARGVRRVRISVYGSKKAMTCKVPPPWLVDR